MMERTTRAIGSMATAERKDTRPATKVAGDGQTRGPVPRGTVQKGRPVGAMTTQNEKATVPNGT